MRIIVHWDDTKGLSAPVHGAGKIGKHSIGAMSLSTSMRVCLNVKDRIDIRWKRDVERQMTNLSFMRDIPSTIKTDIGMLHMRACRNPKQFSNNLANAILRLKKADKNKHGVTKEDILKSLKK